MIKKEISKIDTRDIQELIDNSVAESKVIEYKKDLDLSKDSSKIEFLKDVSSFANTIGGHILFGIEEKNSVPTKIIGIKIDNLDQYCLKIESILRDGIDPRITFHIKAIEVNGRYVLVIEIKKSWLSPHRVQFKGHDRFYARNSKGVYSLDTSELRTAFDLSGTVTERIKEFRMGRIAELANNETPIPFKESAKIVLHFIPLDSFVSETKFKIDYLLRDISKIVPLCSTSYSSRYNLEGIISFSGGGEKEDANSYVQVYRNGIVEVVNSNLLGGLDDEKIIPSVAYEQRILEYLPNVLNLQRDFGVFTPIYISMTLIGVMGYKIELYRGFFNEVDTPINRDIVILPEYVLENFDERPENILRPMFDLVWNACGQQHSYNFDDKNNWKVTQ